MPRHHKHKKESPEIPVSSFSDIAFLLIIFFILATTLAQMKGIVTEIPAGKKAEKKEDKTTSIQMITDTNIRFNEKKMDIEAIRAKLASMNLHEKSDSERIVQLEAVGNVEYQTYFEVLTAISAAGGVTVIVKEDED